MNMTSFIIRKNNTKTHNTHLVKGLLKFQVRTIYRVLTRNYEKTAIIFLCSIFFKYVEDFLFLKQLKGPINLLFLDGWRC